MSTYVVTRKADGVEVFRYSNEAPVEWSEMGFDTHDHTPVVEPPVLPTEPITPIGRRMSKLDYLRLFTQEERIAIRAAGKINTVVEDYLHLLELTDEVNTGDAEVGEALVMMETAGLLAVGRRDEVLNG